MIKVKVSTSLKGELVLSAIKAKLRPGSTVEISEEAAGHADVLWARKKGYISFDSSDDKVDSSPVLNGDEVEFVNARKGGVTISFLGRTLSSEQRFILKRGDPNMEKAMKMVAAGHLTCADVKVQAVESAVAPKQEKKSAKKGSRGSFRRKKSGGEAQQSAEIFGLMNTEVT